MSQVDGLPSRLSRSLRLQLNLEHRDLDGSCANLAQSGAQLARLVSGARHENSFACYDVAHPSLTTLRSSLDLIASGSNVSRGLKPRSHFRGHIGTTKVEP